MLTTYKQTLPFGPSGWNSVNSLPLFVRVFATVPTESYKTRPQLVTSDIASTRPISKEQIFEVNACVEIIIYKVVCTYERS